MDLGLAGQVVAVFGAGRGIGEAIAGAFMAESANVGGDRPRPGRDGGGRAVAAAAARAAGGPWPSTTTTSRLGLVADVTDFAAVRRAADAVRRYFGRCDHVVFAVGVGSGKFGFPFWNLEPADWEPRAAGQPDRRGERGARLRPGMAEGQGRHDALPRLGRRPDRLADRPALQRLEGRADQLRPVRRQGPGPVRRAGQHALPGHGQDRR